MSALRFLTAAAAAVALTLSASSVAQAMPSNDDKDAYLAHVDFDAVSAANPSLGQPTVNDQDQQTARTRARDVKAGAVATSSAICDGCQGAATTLQVLTLERATKAVVDNVATAWASGCSGCGSSSLSVQVILARRVTDLVAANRALAVNAACAGCDSAAAALQFVVIDPRRSELSSQGKDLVDQIRAQLADRLAAAADGPAPRAGARTLSATPGGLRGDLEASAEQLRAALGSDLGAASVQVHTDLHTG